MGRLKISPPGQNKKQKNNEKRRHDRRSSPGTPAKKERKSMKRLLSIAVFTVVMTGWLAANAGKPTPEVQYSQIKGSFTASYWDYSYYPPQKDYVRVSVNVQLKPDGSASGTITMDWSKYTAVSWGLFVDYNCIGVGTSTGAGFVFDIGGAGPGCPWPYGLPADLVGRSYYIERGGYTVK